MLLQENFGLRNLFYITYCKKYRFFIKKTDLKDGFKGLGVDGWAVGAEEGMG